MANGEQIDRRMRILIGVWCRRRLKGNTRGRPSSSIKKTAVQWAFVERWLRSPSRKREAIIEEVANEFGLQRRRVFGLIKGVDLEIFGKAD